MRKRSAREKSGRGNKGWKYWGLVLAVLIAMLSAAAGGAFAEAIEEVSEAEVFTREGSIVNCRPQAGTPLHITSMVPLFQQGVGTASPENVREIVKVSSVTVTQTVDEQTVNRCQH